MSKLIHEKERLTERLSQTQDSLSRRHAALKSRMADTASEVDTLRQRLKEKTAECEALQALAFDAKSALADVGVTVSALAQCCEL